MPDDPRFPHVRFPMFLFDRTRFPWITGSILLTYLGARTFAYFASKCNDRFARCWPSNQTIGERAGQSARTVSRNLAALKRGGVLYRKRRRGTSWMTTFVDAPKAFQEAVSARGEEAAKHENETRLDSIVDEARAEMAQTTRERRQAGNGFVRLAMGGDLITSARLLHSSAVQLPDPPPVASTHATGGEGRTHREEQQGKNTLGR